MGVQLGSFYFHELSPSVREIQIVEVRKMQRGKFKMSNLKKKKNTDNIKYFAI